MSPNGEGAVLTLADLACRSTNHHTSGGTQGSRRSVDGEERTREQEERGREPADRWRTEQLVAARFSELQESGLLSQGALDVARAAAAESRAADTVQIWQGLLRVNPPPVPGGGVGEALGSMAEGASESSPTFSSELQARALPERSDRQTSKLRAWLPETAPSNLQQLVIIPLKDTLLHHRKVPFKLLAVAWLVTVSSVGGVVLWLLEREQCGLSLVDALFTVFSATTCTGLSSFNTSAFLFRSQVLLVICMVCGSSILVSSVPLMLRHAALARNVPSSLLNARPPVQV